MKLSNLIINNYINHLTIKESDLIFVHESENMTTSEQIGKIDEILEEIVSIKAKLNLYLEYNKSDEHK